MTKQKRGLWLFLCSLVPGAGELYMGFRKQGLSIMSIFWGCIALAMMLNFEFMLMILPILWFYSFFNVHNLKSLSPEEFYSIEDDYILHLDRMIPNDRGFIQQNRKVVAMVLIGLGVILICQGLNNALYWILPSFLQNAIFAFTRMLPSVLLGGGILALGFYLISDKRKTLEKDSLEDDDEPDVVWTYRNVNYGNTPEQAPTVPQEPAASETSAVPQVSDVPEASASPEETTSAKEV